MGANNLATDIGPTQALPDDCAHSQDSPHTNTRNCLLVSSPARFFLTEISKHHFAIVQAVPAQGSRLTSTRWQKPTCDPYRKANQCGLRDPSTRSNKQIVAMFRVKTSQDKSTNGSVKPMLTPSESIIRVSITMRSL